MFQMAREAHGTGLGAERELLSGEQGAIKIGQDKAVI